MVRMLGLSPLGREQGPKNPGTMHRCPGQTRPK